MDPKYRIVDIHMEKRYLHLIHLSLHLIQDKYIMVHIRHQERANKVGVLQSKQRLELTLNILIWNIMFLTK